MKLKKLIILSCAITSGSTLFAQIPEKTLVDYFLPAEPIEPLVSEGIWGADNVIPRDIQNGLEDPKMEQWCYWDGMIVKADNGKYYMYASHWGQDNHHDTGWKVESKGIVAVSENLMGPYKDLGEAWPDWVHESTGFRGAGHNVVGLRMHDGRYAMVTSEITHGEVFVSDNPEGTFDLLGQIEVNYNGFHPGLARYNNPPHKMANVMIWPRPDGSYLLMGRNCAPMISYDGITGPYKIMNEQAWLNVEGVPQFKMEDPTIWYSAGMYHCVVNHYSVVDETFHLTSEDGIHDWKNRGIAYKREHEVFRYTDGTVNDWYTVQRPTVYCEDGEVKLFNFSAIDVHKGKDGANDKHGSKIVLAPFDGKAFNQDMAALLEKERAEADATPAPEPWQSTDIGKVQQTGNTGYDSVVDTIRIKATGGVTTGTQDALRYHYQKTSGDIMLTAHILSQDITPDMAVAGVMLRKSLSPSSPQTAAWLSPSHGLAQQVRTEKYGDNKTIKGPKIRAPYFLRLVKQGNQVTTWISQTNQHNWENVGSVEIDLGDEFYAGVATASSNGSLCLARIKALDLHTLGTKNQIINHNIPDVLSADGKITATITYESVGSNYINIGMQDMTEWKGVSEVNQEVGGYGTIELEYIAEGGLEPGMPYQVHIGMRPSPGDWKNSFDTDSIVLREVTE